MDQGTFQAQDTSTLRRIVASYRNYTEAQRAVDYLSDNKFPVERTAIVAEGLRFVEQVTGRLGYGRAALNGLLSGVMIGIFIGIIFGLFSLLTPLLTFVFWSALIGAVIGLIIGVIGYAFTGGRRDFTSVGGMQAERYNVMVDSDVADEALRLLNQIG